MSRSIKLKKGFDIHIRGVAAKVLAHLAEPQLFGVKPVDFPGLIPKLNVRPGDRVKAGTPLFHDKLQPEIVFTSPVSGTILSVDRGERRKILEVVVERSGSEVIDFGKADPLSLTREQVIRKLLGSGLWPAIRQRPYHIVAKPSDLPKSIFISGFDTAPLAPDNNFIADNSSLLAFQTGINVLSKLTAGKINLILKSSAANSPVFTGASGVELSYFSGPHPAGNVGIHIHHLDPVSKGEKVWFVNIQDVYAIGTLFMEGIYRPERIVALTGTEVLNPQYYRMLSGGSVDPIVNGNVKPGNLRYISGNVLTGQKISGSGYLGYYDSQVTVIPEGDYFEFFGWAAPGLKKYSFHRAFLSNFLPSHDFRLDTNLHGGERAFVVTGKYEKVLPMEIYPMHLLKAIMAEDIDAMENLGIYEVAEEDFALCEFICPSKIEIQSVVRKGIELMIREMS